MGARGRSVPAVRIYETVLYAPDTAAAASFYRDALGLRLVEQSEQIGAVFRLDDGGVLLLFDPSRSSPPGRFVPSHGADGPGHIAFSVAPGRIDELRDELPGKGVEIEREIDWPGGGRSLYVRDPAGNSVELVEGELWAS